MLMRPRRGAGKAVLIFIVIKPLEKNGYGTVCLGEIRSRYEFNNCN
ncbi:hypothetical protein ALP34_200077 [Pseudomonas savastanoi pv. glycinea]|nr:hypothetical protein ALP34_200077 [Pseudomonas savastanoi pv. glycinea]